MTTSEESEDSAGPPQVVITLVALAAGLVAQKAVSAGSVSYTHLTLPTTPYV